MDDLSLLKQPFTLPSGETLPNRIAKAAMGENLAKDGRVTDELIYLYDLWSQGGCGLSITGNVMVDHKAVSSKTCLCIENKDDLKKVSQLAQEGQKNGVHLWMQINHPGRQVPMSVNKRNVAPSAVPLAPTKVFGTPDPLKEDEIWDIIQRFATTAKIAQEAGFSGVQIHGAHGYLISQFLSPRTNLRTDDWGGSLENRARFPLEIYKHIRKAVGKDFSVGIKINSADFQRGAFTEEESLQVIELLSSQGIDLIEVSGGTYEQASMMGHFTKESTRQREAYFLDFIGKARKIARCPLMLTGGFRTPGVMAEALRKGELDIIGLARPFARDPQAARKLLNGSIKRFEVPPIKTGVKAIDNKGFLDTKWHGYQLQRMGNGKMPNLKMSAWSCLAKGVVEMVF